MLISGKGLKKKFKPAQQKSLVFGKIYQNQALFVWHLVFSRRSGSDLCGQRFSWAQTHDQFPSFSCAFMEAELCLLNCFTAKTYSLVSLVSIGKQIWDICQPISGDKHFRWRVVWVPEASGKSLCP